MKIAIVRGPSLNKFEMQYYEPLKVVHHLVCFGSTKPIYDISEIELPIVRLNCLGQTFGMLPGATKALYRLFGDPQVLLGLEKSLDGFDIVHTAEIFSFYTHQALLAKGKGKVKKVVATVSENIPGSHEEYQKQKALKKFALENLDHILAISNLSKRALMEEGCLQDKISVVPHGLDLTRFKAGKQDSKLAKKYGLAEDDFIILSVGRLVWEKGFEDLILVAKELIGAENYSDSRNLGRLIPGIVKKAGIETSKLKFIIVGNGPEKINLEKMVRQLKMEKTFIFVSTISYQDMPKIYDLADIFVLASKPTPTWQEQFGMVLIEAMACGIPVVATNSGGIPETIGNAGILVPPGDWSKLTQALKELIRKPRWRQELSQKGQGWVRRQFDKNIVSGKIEKIYQRVLASQDHLFRG